MLMTLRYQNVRPSISRFTVLQSVADQFDAVVDVLDGLMEKVDVFFDESKVRYQDHKKLPFTFPSSLHGFLSPV